MALLKKMTFTPGNVHDSQEFDKLLDVSLWVAQTSSRLRQGKIPWIREKQDPSTTDCHES